MKGLIIKDLMCLRKQRIIFIYLVVVTLVLSVMFVLSSKFGNIYLAGQEMIASEEMGGIAVDVIANEAMIFFMLCPLAMAGEVTAVFTFDAKAGFSNVAATLPLPISKRVLAKYLAAFTMLGIGVIVDMVISFILSRLTDIVTFSEFFGIIISVASVFLMYGAIAIFLCFCMGYGKEIYSQFLSIMIIAAFFVAVNFSKIKEFFIAMDGADMAIMKDALDMLKYQYYIPFSIAIIVVVVSYFGSVFVTKRKRGMI